MKGRRWMGTGAAGIAVLALLLAAPAAGQTEGWGRISLFGMWSRSSVPGGPDSTFDEVTASLAMQSASAEEGGGEYKVDLRGATYPGTSAIANRYSIYDAWIGGRLPGGTLGARVGQMWLNELGSLGSVGGLLLEWRNPSHWGIGRLRAGFFGGFEPKILDAGYEKNIRKEGAFLALDGGDARSHVLGYVRIRDAGMTERSVLTMTNFVPVGRTFFLYQAAEYDLSPPGGLARKGLNYLFANVRYAPSTRIEFQALYHHGRSIDARTITQDQLNGIPVDSRTLEGFLFESVGGRVTVGILPSLHVFGGYSRERDNQNDPPYGRSTFGLFATNVLGSGVDLTVSDNRSNRSGGAYDSWYASLGRNLGGRFYVSANYSTSLSVLSWTTTDGIVIETRPRTKRYSLYGLWNTSRHFSVMLTGERLRDDTGTSDRLLLGLVYRF